MVRNGRLKISRRVSLTLVVPRGCAPRSTVMRPPPQRERAFGAAPVRPIDNAGAGKQQRSKRLPALDDNVQRLHWVSEEPDSSLYQQVVLQANCN